MFQNDATMRMGGNPVRNLAGFEDPEDSGQKAVNYRSEPLWKRMQHAPETPLTTTRTYTDWWDVLSNTKVGGDPQTPVFTVHAQDQVRIRVLQPGGHSRNGVFTIAGHTWPKQPYLASSTRLDFNSTTPREGARFGMGPANHFDVLLNNQAGGSFNIPGDYLIRDSAAFGFDGGLWAILRVLP